MTWDISTDQREYPRLMRLGASLFTSDGAKFAKFPEITTLTFWQGASVGRDGAAQSLMCLGRTLLTNTKRFGG